DVFERTQKAILDMNSVLGDPNNPGSLRSMAVQVGKALNDPILGLTALRRVGVSFSDSQMDVIKNLTETNRLAEAQALILAELESEFGGAAASTINSSIQMKNAWGDYLEALGKKTLPILDGMNLAFANFFTIMAGNMDAYVDNQQDMMVINFRSMNDFSAALALNTDTAIKLVWGSTMAAMGAIDGLFRFSSNSLRAWAKTLWDILDKLPVAALEAGGLGNLDPLKEFASGVKSNFTPALEEAQTSLKIIGDQFQLAISGFKDYEKNFSTITDQSIKTYNKMLELRTSLPKIDIPDPGSGKGKKDTTLSDTEKAYAAMLDGLRKYHSEAALVNLDAHQKAMAKINQQFEEEQSVILASMKAKEISEEEGGARLREIRSKYDAQMLVQRKKADDEIIALAQKRIEQAAKDETAYYETLKFADSGYYAWKKAQIRAEVEAMNIGEQQKLDLIKLLLEELKALKDESDQAAAASPGHWFFTGLLGFDPDKDQDKIEKAKNAFRGLQNSVSTSITGLMELSKQRQQQELSAIDEVAAKQNLSDADIAKRKATINKKYEAEQKRVGNIQKAASIAQTTIHSAEAAMAAYKALAGIPIVGPVLGASAAAAAIAAGAIQIAVIKAQKFATGGLFKGQGGERDDQNLVMLSNNEYVVNAAATKKYLPLLEQINATGNSAAQSTLSNLDKGLLSQIGENRNMLGWLLAPGFLGMGTSSAKVKKLRGIGQKLAMGGLVGPALPALPRVAYADGGLVAGGSGIQKVVEGLGRKLDALNANVAALELSVQVVNRERNIDTTIERQEFRKQKMQSLGKDYTYAV
ncbi:MAG: hypothetical protein WCS56_05625, partial [Bacilli bacterium]